MIFTNHIKIIQKYMRMFLFMKHLRMSIHSDKSKDFLI